MNLSGINPKVFNELKMGSFNSKMGLSVKKGVKIGLLTSFGVKDTIRRPFGQAKEFQGTKETFRAKDGGFRSTQPYGKVSRTAYPSNKSSRKPPHPKSFQRAYSSDKPSG